MSNSTPPPTEDVRIERLGRQVLAWLTPRASWQLRSEDIASHTGIAHGDVVDALDRLQREHGLVTYDASTGWVATERVVPGALARRVGIVEDFTSYLGTVEQTDLADANVVISTLVEQSDDPWSPLMHAPVIDLDVPVAISTVRLLIAAVLEVNDVELVPVTFVPSSTPGHGHLYVDVAMTEEKMWEILGFLVRSGVVEEGFLNASKARGYASVRLPWVSKYDQPDEAETGVPDEDAGYATGDPF